MLMLVNRFTKNPVMAALLTPCPTVVFSQPLVIAFACFVDSIEDSAVGLRTVHWGQAFKPGCWSDTVTSLFLQQDTVCVWNQQRMCLLGTLLIPLSWRLRHYHSIIFFFQSPT